MKNSELNELPQSQQERLFYIDFRLFFLGTVNRNDLVKRFGTKEAASTRDLATYRGLRPRNTEYDSKRKIYIKLESFKPLFNYTAKQVLLALTQGIGDDFIGIHKPMVYCETPLMLNSPSIEILATLSTAIHQQRAALINYCSVNSGPSSREFVPFALVDNGLRWHVRGYDRKRESFIDFVLTRVTRAEILYGQIEEHEKRDADIQWNRIVEMEIVPHPNKSNLGHSEAIKLDYGMVDGVLKVNVRAAVAGYVLRRWNIDCSINHNLEGNEYHLWLRNSAALYGVGNLAIAPGYKSEL